MPTSTDSLETATTDSQESLAAMESEAAEFFATRDASRAVLNPVAPALEKAVSAPAKPVAAKSTPTAAPKASKPTTTPDPSPSKISGAPILKAAAKEATPAAEPAADPATAPATPDFSDIPRQYPTGKVTSKNWDRLHQRIDYSEAQATAARQEADALRAELEAARSTATASTPPPELQTRLTTLQAERDALRSQLETVAGERIFDADSKPRRDAAFALAKSAVSPTDATRIDSILALPESTHRDNAIEELLATLPPLRASKLAQAVASLDQLNAERTAAASQGSELWNRRMAASQAQEERQRAERTARATSTFDTELKEWESIGLTSDDLTRARSVYLGQGATLQDASRAALWAVAGPKIAQMASDSAARIAELEGQLSKLRGAQPGVGASAAGALPSASDDEDDPSITSYADRIAKQAARAGVRFTPSA